MNKQKNKPKSNARMKFIGRRKVLSEVPFSNSTLWRMVKAGEFPAPVKISDRKVAWIESEIEDWKEAQIEKSRAAI